jgi:hypothetical protein
MLNNKIIIPQILVEFIGGINDGLMTHIPYLKDPIDIIHPESDGSYKVRVYKLDKQDKDSHPKYRYIGTRGPKDQES